MAILRHMNDLYVEEQRTLSVQPHKTASKQTGAAANKATGGSSVHEVDSLALLQKINS